MIIQIELFEHLLGELADRVGFAGGDHVVVGLLLLEHQPHRLDVVAGESPVALRFEVSEKKLLLEAQFDPGRGAGDLPGDEGLAAAGRFMVEEDPVGGKEVVCIPVVSDNVVCIHLGRGVGALRLKGG